MDIHKIRGEDHYQCREVKAERDMLKARLDDLQSRLAAAERDAERYRWLRKHGRYSSALMRRHEDMGLVLKLELQLDAAIDKARGAGDDNLLTAAPKPEE